MLRIARGLRKPEVSVPCLEFQFVDADGGFNVGCIAVLLDELVDPTLVYENTTQERQYPRRQQAGMPPYAAG